MSLWCSEGGTQGHCGVSERGYLGNCLVETKHFKYFADFLTLFISLIFLCFEYSSFNISCYYVNEVFC